MPVQDGDAAPEFDLLGEEWGRDAPTHTLSEALAQGGVVLQFFPAPFTGTCEAQMCAVRDHIEDYRGAGVTVYGVTGHYPMLLKAWDDQHHFGAEILADYDHEVSRAYVGIYEDVLPAGLRLCAKRGVIGISRDGVVRSVWISEVPRVGPDQDVIDEAIAAAKG
jgi:glutaredoxin-dependent peroxiredoxin